MLLEINKLCKKYINSEVNAVEDLTLSIGEGELCGFLGLNGSGKSTAIKCIAGVYPYQSGTIKVNGYDLGTDPINAKMNMSYVADNHRVYEKLTGREFVYHTANIYKVSADKRDKIMNEYAELFRLTNALDKQVKSYSHGMKQKICIITALIHQPPLWVMDEPLTGLDPQSCIDVINGMKKHCSDGGSVFFSSHNMELVGRICDKVAIMDKGKLCEVLDLREGNNREELENVFLKYSGEVPVESDVQVDSIDDAEPIEEPVSESVATEEVVEKGSDEPVESKADEAEVKDAEPVEEPVSESVATEEVVEEGSDEPVESKADETEVKDAEPVEDAVSTDDESIDTKDTVKKDIEE